MTAAVAAGSLRTGRAAGFDEPGIKLTFPAGGLSGETLRFMQQVGIRWITAGGPNAPTYSEEGRVILRDGSTDTARGPWKGPEILALIDKAASCQRRRTAWYPTGWVQLVRAEGYGIELNEDAARGHLAPGETWWG